jgi:hypothetical protein
VSATEAEYATVYIVKDSLLLYVAIFSKIDTAAYSASVAEKLRSFGLQWQELVHRPMLNCIYVKSIDQRIIRATLEKKKRKRRRKKKKRGFIPVGMALLVTLSQARALLMEISCYYHMLLSVVEVARVSNLMTKR